MNRGPASSIAFTGKMKPDAESVTSRTIGTEEDERLSRLETSFPCVDLSEDNSALKRSNSSSNSKLVLSFYQMQDDKFLFDGTQVQRLDVTDLPAHHRPIPTARLGKALATLHCSNKSLNLMYRKWSRSKINSFFSELSALTDLLKDEDNLDRAGQQALEYGHEECEIIQSNMQEILKNSIWECQYGGLPRVCFSSMARDFGMPLTFPIACTMAHAIQGDSSLSVDIKYSMEQYWNSYVLQRRREGFVDEDLLFHKIKNGIGWCAFFLYSAYYKRKAYTDILPLQGIGEEDRGIVLETIGLVGIRLMHLCFGSHGVADLSLEDLKTEIDLIIEEETDTLSAVFMVNHEHQRRAARKKKQKRPGGRFRRGFATPRRSSSLVKQRSGSFMKPLSSFRASRGSLRGSLASRGSLLSRGSLASLSESSETRWQTDSCSNIRSESVFKPRQRLPSVFEKISHEDSDTWSQTSSICDGAISPQRVPQRLPTDTLRTSGSFLSVNASSIHASPTRLPRRLPSIVLDRGSIQSVANSELSDRWFNEGSFASQSVAAPERLPSLCLNNRNSFNNRGSINNRNSMASLRSSIASMSSVASDSWHDGGHRYSCSSTGSVSLLSM